MAFNFLGLVVLKIFCLFHLTTSARYYVDSTKSGTVGTSWDTAFKYLDDAINAITGDSINEIWITQGTYYPQTTARESCFTIRSGTYIYGGFTGQETSITQRIITSSTSSMTILDGDINIVNNSDDNCYHVVSMSNGILDSIVIRNGNANQDGDGGETNQFGGGLYVDSDENVNITLNNVQFIDNIAHLGGGLFALQEDNYISIYNSIFENNIATNGTYLGGYGGGIHVSMGINVNIENTYFIDNTATYRGGAIYQDYGASITCNECSFINNSATMGHGGAWLAENRNSQLGTTTSFINNSNFSENSAYGYGGACTFLKESIVYIENSVFYHNIADNRGGAITYYDVTNLTTFNNVFENNIANEDSSTNNIYNGSFPSFTTINSTISYNISQYLMDLWNNRAITSQYNDDLASGNNICYVKQCAGCTTSSFDGTSWNTAYVNIQQCIDKLNNITNLGTKEIWVAKGTYYPTTGLPFATQPEYAYFYSFIMYENIRMYGGFNGNETLRSQRNWYQYPTILSCAMEEMSCTIIMDAANNVIVDGFIFTGALYNTSRENGDQASEPSPQQRRLLASTFNSISQVLENKSGGRGGGIFSNGTNITVVNSIFFENLAVKGGSIYCIGLSSDGITYKSPTIMNVAFINNVGLRGGAIMGDIGCEFQCDSCLFVDNVASEKGGAVYLDYFCAVSINNSQFINNIAYESGGCIANDGLSYALLNTNEFVNNKAKWEGGCLYAGSHISGERTTYYLIDSTFQNNTAYYGFDDIWLWPGDLLTLIEANVTSTTNIPLTTQQIATTTLSTMNPTIINQTVVIQTTAARTTPTFGATMETTKVGATSSTISMVVISKIFYLFVFFSFMCFI